MATKKKTPKVVLVRKVMPYTKAALVAAEDWLDASGVGDGLGDDGDAVMESLAAAFTAFASSGLR